MLPEVFPNCLSGLYVNVEVHSSAWKDYLADLECRPSSKPNIMDLPSVGSLVSSIEPHRGRSEYVTLASLKHKQALSSCARLFSFIAGTCLAGYCRLKDNASAVHEATPEHRPAARSCKLNTFQLVNPSPGAYWRPAGRCSRDELNCANYATILKMVNVPQLKISCYWTGRHAHPISQQRKTEVYRSEQASFGGVRRCQVAAPH